MKNYSSTMVGIIVAVAGPALVQYGFSDACSGEITSKLAPALATLPGAVIAWVGRVRAGGVSVGGFRK